MANGMTVLAGRYLLRDRIGAGGMGEVWQATDEVLGRTVAVKLILPALLGDPDFLRRFLAEARAMASVQHPGVVAIHDFHGDAAGAYLVMEYVDGEPLSRVLGRVGRLSAGATMDVIGQAAGALQAVHDRGIVHRDVKPANLLVRADGTVVLADFGIALGTAGTGITGSGMILGTPSYLAPEQVMGQAASPRSDVYALGVVAYECLAGRRPFVGDNPFAVAMQRVGQAPPPLGPDVPPSVARVVDQALATDPSLRWSSAAELALAAERAGTGLRSGQLAADGQAATTLAHRPDATTVPHRSARSGTSGGPRRTRRGMLTASAAVVLALAAAVVGLVVWRGTDGGAGPSPAASGGTGTGQPGGPSAGTPAQVPAGMVACGQGLCPTAPMCWRGLVQQGDVGRTPGVAACTEPHYWETFAATHLPADAVTDRDLTRLMERSDIGAFCSDQLMAERSRDPAQTQGWRREAWPIPADPYTVLVHCLAGSPEGETPGAVFEAG